MITVKTKFQLFDCFVSRLPVFIAGVTGIMSAIQLEDGSGHNFNVTIRPSDGVERTVFLKTVD